MFRIPGGTCKIRRVVGHISATERQRSRSPVYDSRDIPAHSKHKTTAVIFETFWAKEEKERSETYILHEIGGSETAKSSLSLSESQLFRLSRSPQANYDIFLIFILWKSGKVIPELWNIHVLVAGLLTSLAVIRESQSSWVLCICGTLKTRWLLICLNYMQNYSSPLILR